MSQDIMKSKEEIEEIYGAKNLHQICYMLARDYALRCKLEYRRRNDVESRMWYELEIYDDELKDPVWIFKEDAQKFALLESRVKNRLHKLINSQIEVEKLRYQET